MLSIAIHFASGVGVVVSRGVDMLFLDIYTRELTRLRIQGPTSPQLNGGEAGLGHAPPTSCSTLETGGLIYYMSAPIDKAAFKIPATLFATSVLLALFIVRRQESSLFLRPRVVRWLPANQMQAK